jgi:hypothetical protein
MPEPEVKDKKGALTPVLITAAVVVVIVFLYFLLRQLYIDTHCAEILGTMVCK